MPGWLQGVIGVAAFLTAVGVIWRTALKPGAKLIASTEQMLPVLTALTKELQATPGAFSVLREIVVEFRNNGGSTLRDVVDRLEDAGERNHADNETLRQELTDLRRDLNEKMDRLTETACEVIGKLNLPSGDDQ